MGIIGYTLELYGLHEFLTDVAEGRNYRAATAGSGPEWDGSIVNSILSDAAGKYFSEIMHALDLDIKSKYEYRERLRGKRSHE